jgi:tRNA(Ile)-lysidine synthetase-like protein
MSISGGVDSMVCLYILNQIIKYSNSYKFKEIFLEAIHINYSNRKETIIEEQIVSTFCNNQGINLYIRRVYELNRSECIDISLRELYEDLTKYIRFKSYKDIIDNDDSHGIILGHNKDDCFENFLTNIKNNMNSDNILGMQEFINSNNCNILRPLLNIYKNDIINFAVENNIPYLQDSTPSWSQRGKIRDKIKPVLNDFNINLIDKLLQYVKDNQDLYSQIEEFTIKPFLTNQVTYLNNNSKIVQIKYNQSYINIIWKHILNNIFQNIKNKYFKSTNNNFTKFTISNKTIDNIILLINRYFNTTNKRRNYVVINKFLVGFFYYQDNIHYLEIILTQ